MSENINEVENALERKSKKGKESENIKKPIEEKITPVELDTKKQKMKI